MESSNRKITLKVLVGYIILGVLASTAIGVVFSELRTFTSVQNEDLTDRNKVIRIGGIIADIYENESLARAVIQRNSKEEFDSYVQQNETLLKTIDSLGIWVNNDYQRDLLDSIKMVFAKKRETLVELMAIKNDNATEASIKKTIEKLNSIDPILGKLRLEDYVVNPETLTPKTKNILLEFIKISNELNAKDSIKPVGQKQIDSIVTASKALLRQVQGEITYQRTSQLIKERELIENDLQTSRQLRNLLKNLESEMQAYTQSLHEKRNDILNRSINILSFAAIAAFVLVVLFSILILNDFWKTQRYRKQLEKSNEYTSSLLKSREQLMHMVSHDLRSPLSTISGYSELLQKSEHSSKNSNYLKHIQSASKYMAQLVEGLLEFSKLEGGKIEIEDKPFDLNALMKETCESLKAVHLEKPIKMVMVFDPKFNKIILSDPFRIRQILHNLVGNAFKFTQKGNITISSKLSNGGAQTFAHITVTDTGIGISTEKQEEIFNEFTQVHKDEGQKAHGFGLGLAITKKLVGLLNGTLTLQSSPGKGSTFEVKIPIRFSENQEIIAPVPTKSDLMPLMAVVVDDDASLRQLITEVLRQKGIASHVFENGKTALEGLKGLTYDFIITDIQLPKMNGFHFMEMVKNLPDYKGQPIIAVTGRTEMKAAHYKESGFATVVFKPFGPDKLLDAITQLFPKAKASGTQKNLADIEKTELFDTSSISGFLDDDPEAMHSILMTFLADTKANIVQMKNAKKIGDIKTINDLSHRMLGMFKQLEINSVVPFLEKFEKTETIDNNDFDTFETRLKMLCVTLEKHLNRDRTL